MTARADANRMGMPDHLYLHDSPVHGVGLFTRVPYNEGEVCFVGKRRTAVIDDPDVPIATIDGCDVVPRVHCPQVGPKTYHVYTFDSFMNHSSEPNTRVVYVDDVNYYHLATRHIDAGDELTVSYHEVYSKKFPDPVMLI